MENLTKDISVCANATHGFVVWETRLEPYPFRQVCFEGHKQKNKLLRLKGDCVVRAIALATDTPYDDALSLVEEYGDLGYRGGAYMHSIVHGLHFHERTYHGKVFKWQPFQAIKGHPRMNPMSFCQKFKTGRYIVKTACHVFAVVDGIAYDTFAERPDRCIYGAWEVVEA